MCSPRLGQIGATPGGPALSGCRRRRAAAWGGICLGLLWSLSPGGCQRPAQSTERRRSPLETIQQLISARSTSTYERFRDLVVPGQAEGLIRTLSAIDQFLVRNRELCNYVREHFDYGTARMIDQSYLASMLEVFSDDVRLVAERIEGRQAFVSFMVGNRLPLRRARLVLLDGSWRYDPGTGFDPQIPRAFREMARGLEWVLADLKSGRIDAARVRDDPRVLAHEVMLRLTPGVKLLPAGAASRPGGG